MAARMAGSADRSRVEQELRVLNDTELSLLALTGQFEVVSSEQCCRMFFSYPGSLRYAQDLLKRLCEDDGLLLRSYLPRSMPGGRARYLWRLSNAGRRALTTAAADVELRPRFRPSEGPLSRGALEHLLGTTDFSVAALKLCQAEPRLSVAIRPEWHLKAKPVRVPDGNRNVAVIPDSHYVFRNDRSQGLQIVYEHDMGTERRAKLTTKLRHLIAFLRGPYKAYGAELITIAILAPTPARAHQILGWLEPLLKEEKAEDLADLFWVAGTSATATTPHDLFLSPLWHVPLHPGSYALLKELLL